MKHLHNFDTVAEYEAVKDTLEMPFVVSIDETDGLQYNTDVIRVPQGSGDSGGADLEGEYFLAKPNGRYWKLNFLTYHETGVIRAHWDSLNEEQQALIHALYLQILANMNLVYTCVGEKVVRGGMVPPAGIYYTTYGKIQSNLGYSAGRMEYDPDKEDLFSCFAWQEAYPNLPPDIDDSLPEGITITSILDVVKVIIELDQGYSPSDEEMYAFVSEIYMIEPITKEEYENFVSNAKNESY